MLRMDVFEIYKLFENFSCLWEFMMICIELFWEVFSYYIKFFDERLEVYEYIGRLNKVIYGLKRRILFLMKKEILFFLIDIEFDMFFKILCKISCILFFFVWGKDL